MSTHESSSLQGKTVVITGATTGIGKATAIALARQGADVVMPARDRARGEAARREILAARPGARVDLLSADLASFASVRALAAELIATYPRIDLLVNNAGVSRPTRALTVDGYEMTFAVNYLAPFLLTTCLLDRLEASAPARIVNVSSAAHAKRLDFDNLQGERRYSLMGAYSTSKLALILHTYELARRLEGAGVTANAVHPGGVRTEIYRDLTGVSRVGIKLVLPFLRTPEKGASTSVYVATAPELSGVSGRYFADSREKASSPASYDLDTASRLWELTEKMVGGLTPNAVLNISEG